MKSLLLLSTLIAIVLSGGCGEPKPDSPGDAKSGSPGNAMPVVVDGSNFEEVVLKSDKPVLVDFWATWCGPCKVIAPTVEEIAKDYEGRAVVAKLDIDKAKEVAIQYEVSSIPTLIVFNGGQEVARVVGVAEKSGKSWRMILYIPSKDARGPHADSA